MIIVDGLVVVVPTLNPSWRVESAVLLSKIVNAESNRAAGAHRIVAAALREPSVRKDETRNTASPAGSNDTV
jgi:hypothetical protein